jgi:hypothetical protein
MPRRLFERLSSKAAASEGAESYSSLYVEPLSDVRTPLAAFLNNLLSGEEEESGAQ